MDEPARKQLDAQTVISIKHQGAYDEIGSVYHEINEWARQNNVKTKGKGFTVFLSAPNKFDWSSALFEVCIPVESAPEGDSKVAVKELPPCTVASTIVKGPYSEIPARYAEMIAWLSVEGWGTTGSPREVYIQRPDAKGGGDSSDFLTEIQFPVNAQ